MPQGANIQLRQGTAAAWTSANPVLNIGEQGFETDTNKVKIGDGVTAWTSLAYFTGGNDTITLSGDVSGSGTIAITTTLATVNGNVGTFGGFGLMPTVTLNGKGLATAASNISLQGTTNQINLSTTDFTDLIWSTPQNIDTGADVTFNTVTADLVGNADTATAAATVNTSNEATDTTCFPLFVTASGTQTSEPKNNTSFTFNSSTKNLGVAGATITGASDITHLVIKENATQTANPFEIQTSAAATIFRILAGGDIQVSNQIVIERNDSGDPVLVYDIDAGATWYTGVDNSDADKYKEALASDLSSAVRVMTINGEQTIPFQPSFFAYNSVTDANVTGDGTVYTIIFNIEVTDPNSDYNNGTGVFTAPVTGRYAFHSRVLMATGGATTLELRLVTSNRTYVGSYQGPTKAADGYTALSVSCDCVDMDAGDTAFINVVDFNSTKVDDVYGDTSTTLHRTYFSGTLIA